MLGQRLIIPSGGRITAPEWNDEFVGDGSDWVIGGSNDVTFGGGVMHMESGMTAHRASIPPLPFTMEAYMSAITFNDINSQYAGAGLCIAEAAPAGAPGPKFWGPDLDVDILGTICMFDGRWSNFGTQTGHLGTKLIETAGLALQIPTWFRIVVNSATDMDAYWSFDGETWVLYGTGFNPTLTPGAVMFMSYACVSDWEWVRFY